MRKQRCGTTTVQLKHKFSNLITNRKSCDGFLHPLIVCKPFHFCHTKKCENQIFRRDFIKPISTYCSKLCMGSVPPIFIRLFQTLERVIFFLGKMNLLSDVID